MKLAIRFFIFWMVCFLSSQAICQTGECGTSISEQLTTYDHVQNKLNWHHASARTGMFVVPLQFHIIGANNGAFAIDSVLLFEELARVNLIYANANIEFRHCGLLNYIYSNAYVTFIKNDDEDLCDLHDIYDAINIYFAPNVERSDGESLCGYAYNYDVKQRVIMDNGCSTNGSTLAHELGHSFSLLHTHSTSFGREFVDGSNCNSAGDMLCDTPADPKLSSSIVESNCMYSGTAIDPKSQPYTPDTRNIMSYSRKSCRVHFSQEQLSQIESYHMIFQDRLSCLETMTASVGQEQSQLTITPNPFSSHIHLSNVSGPANIKLYAQDGRLVYKNDIDTNGTLYEVVTSSIPSGIYYVIVIQNGERFMKKIVKL